jgi:uncharacterized caspase-like protein
VVVGIEKYRGVVSAPYAAADAVTVRDYMTQALNIPKENVRLLVNDRASMADIKSAIESWLVDHVEGRAEVFFFYSGHGAPNPTSGEMFMVPYDGEAEHPENTGYSMRRLNEVLEKLKARATLVVLDACFSGAGGPRSLLARGTRPMVNIAPEELPRAGVVLSATTGSQISGIYERKGHGLMTYYFLRGLQGAADANGDKKITLEELHYYLKPLVIWQARKDGRGQEPQLQRSKDGGLGIWAQEPLVELQ